MTSRHKWAICLLICLMLLSVEGKEIFRIQVGAYPTQAEAKAKIDALKQQGIFPVQLSQSPQWWKVVIGEFGYYADASHPKKQLRNGLFPGAFIITEEVDDDYEVLPFNQQELGFELTFGDGFRQSRKVPISLLLSENATLEKEKLYQKAINIEGTLLADDGIAALETFVSRFPSDDRIWKCRLRLGEWKLNLKQFPQAKSLFEQVISSVPNKPAAGSAALHLAKLKIKQQDVPSAKQYLKSIIQGDVVSEGTIKEEATVKLRQLLRQERVTTDTLYQKLEQAYEKLNEGKDSEAQTLLQQVYEATDSNSARGEAALQLGLLKVKANDFPAAIALFKKAAKAELPIEPHLRLDAMKQCVEVFAVKAELIEPALLDALQTYLTNVTEVGEAAPARLALAMLRVQRTENAKAEALLQKVMSDTPWRPEAGKAAFKFAKLKIAQNKPGEAKPYLEKVKNDELSASHITKREAFQEWIELVKAEKVPSDTWYQKLQLAYDKLEQKDEVTATQLFVEVAQSATHEAAGEATMRLGYLKLRDKKTTDALPIFISLAKGEKPYFKPHQLEAMERAAKILHGRRMRRNSLQAFNEAEAVARASIPNPEFTLARAGLYMELAQSGKGSLAECRKACKEVLQVTEPEEKQTRATAELMHLETYFFEKNYDPVVQLASQFEQTYSDQLREFGTVLFWKGQALRRLDRKKESHQVFWRIRHEIPDDAPMFRGLNYKAWALYDLGRLYKDQGDKLNEDHTYEQVIQKYPNSYIARLLSQRKHKLEEIRERRQIQWLEE